MKMVYPNIYRHGDRFRVSFTVKRKTVVVGSYATLEQAIEARSKWLAQWRSHRS